MKTGLRALLLSFSFVLGSLTLTAAAGADQKEGDSFNAVEVIMHHIADAHEFHILDYTDAEGVEHPVSLPLPVILYTNGKLDVFMSSEFDHGHADVIKGSHTYRLDHGHIIELGGGHPYDFSITKNVFSMFLSIIILLLIFVGIGRSYRHNNKEPRGLASFMEPLVLFVRDDIAVPNIGEKKADKFLPYLLTVFFFIWINNLLGLIPFFPGSANLTGNISFTITLAFITFLITNLNGNKEYWKHIVATPGVPFWLAPIMIPVEVMGILAKPIALLIRLFANITAGHIIILSLISLIFIFKTIAIAPVSVGFVLFMNVLELLVAALQAYIFTLLSSLFIGMAVAEHEHH